ncbi:5'/3'-nucleotidase SurE [Puniceicoccaceae bacterium K14]|nr:5'/3'-nucleotidase SurE [Puniceicoccaceae bacterium K14]
MNILLTNDDGFRSPLFRILADTLKSIATVTIVAPASEQSWIGKAMSRHKTVSVKEITNFGTTAYALGGTPGDCVNIGLNHLLSQTPDWVVSGINIGHNAGLACIASSGTVAAAVEGCLHEIPSIAASIYLPPEIFDSLKDGHDTQLPAEAAKIVKQAAQSLARFIQNTKVEPDESYGVVHNFNFPYKDLSSSQVKETTMASTMTRSLFEKNENGEYQFTYHEMTELPKSSYTDRQCLKDGQISYSKINYTDLSK